MYKNISTGKNYPKTLVVRNRPDGMIWQVYHVNSERSAEIIAEGAVKNAFEGVTLEDYQPNMEETSPDWQNDFRTNIELRLIEGDNKIKYLINAGYITLEEVLEYVQEHTLAS